MGPGHPAVLSCWERWKLKGFQKAPSQFGSPDGDTRQGFDDRCAVPAEMGKPESGAVCRGWRLRQPQPSAPSSRSHCAPACRICSLAGAVIGKCLLFTPAAPAAEHVCVALIDCLEFLISFSRRSIILPVQIPMLVFSCSVALIFLSLPYHIGHNVHY